MTRSRARAGIWRQRYPPSRTAPLQPRRRPHRQQSKPRRSSRRRRWNPLSRPKAPPGIRSARPHGSQRCRLRRPCRWRLNRCKPPSRNRSRNQRRSQLSRPCPSPMGYCSTPMGHYSTPRCWPSWAWPRIAPASTRWKPWMAPPPARAAASDGTSRKKSRQDRSSQTRQQRREAKPVRAPKRKEERPAQDEWGMFDPAQCGSAALFDDEEWAIDGRRRRPSVAAPPLHLLSV